MFRFFLVSLLLSPLMAQIKISAPEEIPAGAEIRITWSGGSSQREFVTMVPVGTAEGKYGHFQYNSQNHWETLAPEAPGDYEIRYYSDGSPYKTLASKALKVTPVTATLMADATATQGSVLKITWKGPTNKKDFITIVAENAPEKKYGKYKYIYGQTEIELGVPDEVGDYEIRYLTGIEYRTLASKKLTVTDVSASLSAVDQAAAGSPVEIQWTGPNNPRDFITIVPADFPERKYKRYKYTAEGNPIQIIAPDDPGPYEIRYLMGASYKTLASRPLQVIGTQASLSCPSEMQEGGMLEVTWQGPDNPRDFITLVEKGTPDRKYGRYRYTTSGNPVKLRVPDQVGEYEIRYLTGQTYQTLASAPLLVSESSATLVVPAKAQGNQAFEVKWTGPNNQGDYIAITQLGAKENQWIHFTYTHRGSPLKVMAPDQGGTYEVRYQMGQSNRILARETILVEPPEQKPGFLIVQASKNAAPSSVAVEVILDASGSMLKQISGKRRIEVAKSVLAHLVDQTLPEGTPFALRVFGHLEADSCRTDLVVPLAPLKPKAIQPILNQLQAQNLAKTPIADSLDLVAEDLKGHQGPKTVVLITDGEETCGGDPAQIMESLKAKGFGVTVNIVGFALEDADLAQQFRYWSDLGGGLFFEASNEAGLSHSMANAIQPVFAVWDLQGQRIAQGTVQAEPLALSPGAYILKCEGHADIRFSITAEKTETVVLGP